MRVHRLPTEKKDDLARIAIIVSAKVAKKSMDRHLNKRKISACLEKDLNLIKPGQYLIFQVQKDITKLESATLVKEIKTLLNC